MGLTDFKKYSVATLGSHSALQILKGAKDEGFRTICICEKKRAYPYKSFNVADEIIELDSFRDFADIESQLVKKNAILIPHGTFVDVFGKGIENTKVMYYGNKRILHWEADRMRQREWLKKSGLLTPKIFKTPEEIDRQVIVKFHGAAGGKGYFLAKNAKEFYNKIRPHKGKEYILQEYIIGAPIYVHYFYSLINKELEIMSFDKRYESNADSIGRIAAKDQIDLGLETSYNITGNIPIVVRESLLPKFFEMGESVVKLSQEIESPGLFGPFSLEVIVTPDLEFYVFEISARIVAGTNPYVNGSPYTWLKYDVPMSTGRRIALDIKQAIGKNMLKMVLG